MLTEKRSKRRLFGAGLWLVLLLVGLNVSMVGAQEDTPEPASTAEATAEPTPLPRNAMMIEVMREQSYPGSPITIEEKLKNGSNYDRYIVSYRSDGLKINALMTVPRGDKPKTGWPVIVFNHGFIQPSKYRTTERYIAYVDAFASNGYIVFKSDYRGHGDSEGSPTSAYGSTGYTVDVLNGLSSIKQYPDADPARIGMWGHSMGGFITLRAMVISKDIKAGVIWGGVVGSYTDLQERWRRRRSIPGAPSDPLDDKITPDEQRFYDAISANSYLKDLSGPIQLHHGTKDTSVPVIFSQILWQQIHDVNGKVELYLYEGDNHDISNNLTMALFRSVLFFDKYVKKAQPTDVN
jgi:dipeptidyl aminopeptidase/acylaminoacyl peptidase